MAESAAGNGWGKGRDMDGEVLEGQSKGLVFGGF